MGCQKKNDEQKEEVKTSAQTTVVTEDTLGYRTADLEDDVKSAKTIPDVEYSKDPAGTSKKIPRAYDNAPPMIPHDTEGMLPITTNNNQCVGCHMPEVASSMGATPIPTTHFTNYRPTTVYKNGELVKEGKTVSPDGDIGNSIEVLSKLGYKYSFTTKRGVWEDNSNDLLINRIPIYYHDTLPIFVNKCYGINIEDNLSFRAVISKILNLLGAKEWIKRKLKFKEHSLEPPMEIIETIYFIYLIIHKHPLL